MPQMHTWIRLWFSSASPRTMYRHGKVACQCPDHFRVRVRREIKIDDPKPPTSGAQYVENWDEFGAYLSSAIKTSGKKNEI